MLIPLRVPDSRTAGTVLLRDGSRNQDEMRTATRTILTVLQILLHSSLPGISVGLRKNLVSCTSAEGIHEVETIVVERCLSCAFTQVSALSDLRVSHLESTNLCTMKGGKESDGTPDRNRWAGHKLRPITVIQLTRERWLYFIERDYY